jgi:adenylate kinase
MIPGARLILLGRQGAGKGTQCVRLSRHFVVPHISTGDMLRAAVREGTDLGRMAKKIMDDGGLVGDDIMIGLVNERLSHHVTAAPPLPPVKELPKLEPPKIPGGRDI